MEMKFSVRLGFLLLLAVCSQAQNLAPNPSFEQGDATVADWVGQHCWQDFGHTGSRCVSINGNGSGIFAITPESCPLEPGQTYALHYWTMATNAAHGAYQGGFKTVTRDQTRPPGKWVRNTVIATLPITGTPKLLIGGMQISGTTYFDDVELYRVQPLHRRIGRHLLGAGESAVHGQYAYRTPFVSPQYSDYAGNYARGLVAAAANFGSIRWYMDSGSYLIYRHELSGLLMTNATIKGSLWNYHVISNTSLQVLVSSNGVDWTGIGQVVDATTFPQFQFEVPSTFLPATQLYVQLRSDNAKQFSLMDYSFTAAMPGLFVTGKGETVFLEQPSDDLQDRLVDPSVPSMEVLPVGIADRLTGRVMVVKLANPSPEDQTFSLCSQAEMNGVLREWTTNYTVPPAQTNSADVILPTAGAGENTVRVTATDASDAVIFDNSFTTWVSMLADSSYGEQLAAPEATPVWWCGENYKVGRTRALPVVMGSSVRISGARNEYEPFQLVLRPNQSLTNVTAAISDFISVNGAAAISATNVTLALVEYVPVTELYGALESSTGDTADPLVPITAPFAAPAFTNTTIWFTVKIPKDVPAGIYTAQVNLGHEAGAFSVPVELRVYDFTLSDATHYPYVVNVVIDELWHRPANQEDRRRIWDLYMANLARHRVTPYMPQEYQPIEYAYNPASGTFTYNFTNFDAAMSRYLDEFHFTSFQWLHEIWDNYGAAGILRYSYDANGNRIINPEFKRIYPKLVQPIAQHLREKGWFDKAYCYWIDEPQMDTSAPVLSLVKDGFRMVGDAVPGLKRMLPDNTYDFPKPDLYGDVDIWVPAFDPWNFKPERNAERQAKGEKIWPYVFMRPLSPWPNDFIDQPATCPRLRSWIGEKLNWDGELYWGINYYFNLPGVGPRNPWTTPFVRDGGGAPYGNSDGSLVYPPVRNYPTNPVIAGPIDSIRWEVIRDGQEDREYFWTLKQLIAAAERDFGPDDPAVLAARAAQQAALQFVPWPPDQPYKPEDFIASRELIANAIESLGAGRPVVAEQPAPKSARVGTSEYLQAEIVGWPLPELQWQHAGTNLPGANGARLWLNNLNHAMAGDYRLVAVNSSGCVTSSVASLTVFDELTLPQIIDHVDLISSTNGGRAVLSAAVSSVSACTYQWQLNGELISGATNQTLVLTNIDGDIAGNYSVIVANSVGAVVSSSMGVEIPLAPTLHAQPLAGKIRITINCAASDGQLECSSDLVHWIPLATVPKSPLPQSIDDPVAPVPRRFYRVVIPR